MSLVDATGLEVAVIGMSGRFTKFRNLDEFWEGLASGEEGISSLETPADRPEGYVPAYGLMDDKETFDPKFFGYSHRESEIMDPQVRAMHQAVWHALENAGCTQEAQAGRTGLFVSASANTFWEYLYFTSEKFQDFGAFAGSQLVDKDYMATRISYNLNLTGPSISMTTACSSSLVAIHMAAQSLLNGECDIAIAGGVSITNYKEEGYVYQDGMINSPDGHCKPFDHRAAGTVGGEGVGVVVLKRYDDAEGNDHIRAIIKGSAINNDGNDKIGYTAPSIEGQYACIKMAHLASEVEASSIDFVETHGTATKLGDPIEVEALAKAFGTTNKPCGIGSVKSNLGHLDAAAGVAGFIKTVLSLEKRLLPPSLHFEKPNPKLKLEATNFFVNKELNNLSGDRLRAGVSSFGIGGTNAHVVLESAVKATANPTSEEVFIFPISAKSEKSLEAYDELLSDYLSKQPDLQLKDVAYTLRQRRTNFPVRRAYQASTVTELTEKLSQHNYLAQSTPKTQAKTVFMFSGQGSQYHRMAYDLYESDSYFREVLEVGFSQLTALTGTDIKSLVYGETANDLLNETQFLQPVLFCLEYAMASKLIKEGIKPDVLIGHSLGEYTAACIAGVFSIEDALKIVVHRGKTMQSAPKGSMLSANLSEEAAHKFLEEGVGIATINGPEQIVFSGSTKAISALQERLQLANIEAKELRVSHAFHSSLMEEVKDAFLKGFDGVKLNAPEIPLIANYTGKTETEVFRQPEYWWNQLRNSVKFYQGLTDNLDSDAVCIEVGPANTLSNFARKSGFEHIVSTMRAFNNQIDDQIYLTEAKGKMWVYGVGTLAKTMGRVVPLPGYAFEKVQFDFRKLGNGDVKPGLTQSDEQSLVDWIYTPSWKLSTETPTPIRSKRTVWFFMDENVGWQSQVLKELLGLSEVLVIKKGEKTDLNSNDLRLHPTDQSGYNKIQEILSTPEVIVFGWGILDSELELKAATFDEALDQSFFPLVNLVRSLSYYRNAIKLNVLSEGAFGVLKQDKVNPFNSCIQGPARLAEIETEHIKPSIIDIEESTDATALAEELLAEQFHPTVALRAGNAWVPTFNSLTERIETPEQPYTLKENGVYLLLGGLGGIGLEMARYFESAPQSKVILTGQRRLPARDQWQAILNGQLQDSTDKPSGLGADLVSLIQEKIDQLAKELPILEIEKEGTVLDDLNAYCAACSMAYLQRHLEVTIGAGISEEDLKAKLHIAEKYNKLLAFMLFILKQQQWIETKGHQLIWKVRYEGDISTELPVLVAKHERFAGLFELVFACTMAYDQILTGEKEPVAFLYEGSPTGIIADKMRHIPEITEDKIFLSLAGEILIPQLVELIEKKGKIRILEVGAGNGKLTEYLLPHLDPTKVEYCFSDIAKANLIKSEQRGKELGLDYIDYQVLDISRDPVAQGFQEESFDIVLGYNVVHVPKNTNQALLNLKSLLSPNGYLMLLESTFVYNWTNLIWGLVEGWLDFEDAERQENFCPLMTTTQWEQQLTKAGFEQLNSFARKEGNTAIMIGQKPVSEEHIGDYQLSDLQQRLSQLLDLEKRGIHFETLHFDIANEEELKRNIQYVANKYGELNGVFQLAVTPKDCTLQNVDEQLSRKLLAPKIQGTLNLMAALKHVPVDFVLLSSALTSFVSAVGQIHYATSNLFTDALAHAWKQERPDLKVLSVNWDRWISTGTAVEVEKHHQKITGESLEGGFTPEKGLQILNHLFQLLDRKQVVVATRMNADYLSRTLKLTAPVANVQSRSNSTENTASKQEDVAQVIKEEFGKFFDEKQVNPNHNFFELGLNSLDIVTINGKIKQRLGLDIQITDYYTYPSLKQFIDHFTPNEIAPEVAEAPENGQSRNVKNKLKMLKKKKDASQAN